MRRVKLDKIDRKILFHLQEDGRMTNVDLAKKAGILRVFEGVLEPWSYTPLNDAEFVAEEIKKRLGSGVSRSF